MAWRSARIIVSAVVALAGGGAPGHADAPDPGEAMGVAALPGYADLVAMLEPAPLVLAVEIRKVVPVDQARAGTVRPGRAQVYVEARPLATLRGALPAAPLISYLADVPLDARGKLPPLVKRTVMLVARPVPDQPAMLQLVAPDAQWPADPAATTTVRTVLAALAAPDAPGRVTGVREAGYVPGTLAGEGETQIFLTTANGSPAAITVVHRPGQPPAWSVSFSELADGSAKPPAHDTLEWYRLACSLPAALPATRNISATAPDQALAADDYRLVMAGLGPCGRHG